MKKSIKGQEEMVGFAIIVVIIAVVLLIFLGFSLKTSSNDIDSYEVESFLTAMSHYTTECQDLRGDFLEIRELISKCNTNENCLEGEKSCEVLNETIHAMLESSWRINNNSAVKGYSLSILVGIEDSKRELQGFSKVDKGNVTRDSRGAQLSLPRTDIFMSVYY